MAYQINIVSWRQPLHCCTINSPNHEGNPTKLEPKTSWWADIGIAYEMSRTAVQVCQTDLKLIFSEEAISGLLSLQQKLKNFSQQFEDLLFVFLTTSWLLVSNQKLRHSGFQQSTCFMCMNNLEVYILEINQPSPFKPYHTLSIATSPGKDHEAQ